MLLDSAVGINCVTDVRSALEARVLAQQQVYPIEVLNLVHHAELVGKFIRLQIKRKNSIVIIIIHYVRQSSCQVSLR